MSIEAWLVMMVIFLVQVVIAVYLFQKGRTEKRPAWAYRSLEAKESHPELYESKVTATGQSTPATYPVMVKRLLFWNMGKATISKDDIKRPLRVEIGGARVYARLCNEPVILCCSREEIGFEVRVDDDSVELSFDFLDRDDGALFDIFYVGHRWAKLRVTGTIKGARKMNHIGTFWMVAPEQGRHTLRDLVGYAILIAIPPAVFLWAYLSGNFPLSDLPFRAYGWAVCGIGTILWYALVFLLIRISVYEAKFPEWVLKYIPERPID